jgi:hypothetical protein
MIKVRPRHAHCILTGFSCNATPAHPVTAAVIGTMITETQRTNRTYNEYRRFSQAHVVLDMLTF